QRDFGGLIRQNQLDRAVVVHPRDLDRNHLCAAGRDVDLVGGQRQRKIGPALVADDNAIDEIAAAAAEEILDGDLDFGHASGDGEIDERIAAAGAIVAGGELLAGFFADEQDSVEWRAKLARDHVEAELLSRFHVQQVLVFFTAG